MSASAIDSDNKMKPGGASTQTKPTGAERRRRKRVKISGQVHLKAKDCSSPFEEVCKTVDVSRDGVLFTSVRSGYWKGQLLDVTFPYSCAADTWNQPQNAEVVRVDELPDKTFSVAVQFHKAKEAVRTSAVGYASAPQWGKIGERVPELPIGDVSPSELLPQSFREIAVDIQGEGAIQSGDQVFHSERSSRLSSPRGSRGSSRAIASPDFRADYIAKPA